MLKRLSLILLGLVVFTSCEEENPTSEFIDAQTILNPTTPTDPIDPTDPTDPTDPINPVVGDIEVGDKIAEINSEDFILSESSAVLTGTILSIKFTGEDGKTIELTIENPEIGSTRYEVNSKNDLPEFTGVVTDGDKIYSTKFSSEATGVLDLNYNGEKVNGQFFYTPFFLPLGSTAASEFLAVDNGQFKNITVEN